MVDRELERDSENKSIRQQACWRGMQLIGLCIVP